MKKYFTLLLLFVTVVGFAQSDRGSSTLDEGFKIKKKGMKGHAYLLNDWVKGFAVDLNGKLTEQKLLNYDIYNNRLTFKKETASPDVMVVSTNSYSGFMLSDELGKNYLFSKIEGSKFSKAKEVTKFYQVVSPPSKNVIIESIKKMKDPNSSGWSSSSLTTKGAEFILHEFIYVLNNEGKYIRVHPSQGSLLKALKSKKKELQAFIKENNISIKKAEDMAQILEYYHTL